MAGDLSGVQAIAAMFAQTKAEGRAAFLPYYPIGYPTYEESIDAIEAMAQAGVDGFEIGVPFSDPLADGPVIQGATQIALENGVTVQRCLEAIAELRRRGVTQPMLCMSNLNPLLAYGAAQFVKDAQAAGVDGLIIPDLPPEEIALFAPACEEAGMAQVFLVAPTSNQARIQKVAEVATGFIYLVSVTGVTGVRSELPPDLNEFIQRVRQETDTPLVVGFGIGTPAQASLIGSLTDGFIVGSALVRAGKAGVDAVRDLAASLRGAIG